MRAFKFELIGGCIAIPVSTETTPSATKLWLFSLPEATSHPRQRTSRLPSLLQEAFRNYRPWSKLRAIPGAKRPARPKTVAYHVSEQLRTPEVMAAYLDAWFVEDPEDAAGIAQALGDIARAKGMAQVAKDAGLSRESLYKALSANGNPSFSTVLKVAKALGVRLNVLPA